MLSLLPLEYEEQLNQIQKLKRESGLWVNTPLYVVAHAYFYRSHADIYCFHDGDTVIGVVILDNHNGEFTDLVIGDDYQGRGFGKQAINLIIDKFRTRGINEKVKLSVHKANEVARHIYEQAGFIITGEAIWDNSFLNMELPLLMSPMAYPEEQL